MKWEGAMANGPVKAMVIRARHWGKLKCWWVRAEKRGTRSEIVEAT